MFAANFQPSWPSRPKTKGLLLFYFLKLYNFGFYEIFVGSTGSELQHHGSQKSAANLDYSQTRINVRGQFPAFLASRPKPKAYYYFTF